MVWRYIFMQLRNNKMYIPTDKGSLSVDGVGYLEVESELFNKKENFELCNQSNIEKNQLKKKECKKILISLTLN